MTEIAAVRHQVETAPTVADLLDAAYVAFETIMAVIRSCEHDPDAPVAGLAFAAAAAGDGRDAVAAAPSLRKAGSAALADDRSAAGAGCAAGVVAALAGLGEAMARRLGDAARADALAGDRQACADGAWHAGRIRDLLAGGDP